MIPHVYEEQELPISEVCVLLDQLYQDGHYGYLARLMRKYNSYLTQTALVQGFSALAKIVATPPSPQLSPENIYQCALALKTLLAEVEGDVLPVDELGGCVSNLVNIMGDPRFAQNPNLIWPIINLLVKMIKSIPTALGVEQSAAAIQRGLAGMASKEGHEQLMFSALAELFSTLLYLCFQPFKQDYPTSTSTPPKALI